MNKEIVDQALEDAAVARLCAEVVMLRAALNTAKNAVREMAHAHQDPNWFTREKPGADAHFRLWHQKAQTAFADTTQTVNTLKPTLPICAAYGVKSKYGFDPANGHKQLLGLSIGQPGTVFDDQIVELFTADALADAWREGQKAEAAYLSKCDSYYARGDFGNHPQRVGNPYAPANLIAPADPRHL